jgi:hypothetical protein
MIEYFKQPWMEEGLSHHMEGDLFSDVQLRDLVQDGFSQILIHESPLAGHNGIRTKGARKVTAVRQLNMDPFKLARKIGR